MGKNRGDTGADVVSFNQGDLTDTNAAYIGDRVRGAGGKNSGSQSDFTGARTRFFRA